MRRLMCGLLGASLLAGPALAAENCSSPADRQIFEIAALKSEAMVLAESCHQEDRYNAFIERYKPLLLANEHAFDAYFKRVYGRSGQAEHDAYITALANAQSDVGLKQGTDFCPHTEVIFNEVMAVPDAKDLVMYAAGKDLLPASLGSCIAPEPAESRTRAVRHIVHTTKKQH